MANEVLLKQGTAVVLADVTDYAGDGGTRTDQIDLTSIANNAARQSAKVDLGALRAPRHAVTGAMEVDVAPASGTVIELYWGPSTHATAATANPGGLSGSDAAYSGTSGDSLDDSLKQLDFIGAIVCTSDADPALQIQTFVYSPTTRYGCLVVYNKSGQAFVADAIEMFVTFTPLIDEIQ